MLRHIVIMLGTSLALAGCATTGPDADPLQGYNRAMFGANRAVDRAVVRPAATVYRTVTPVPARRGFARVLDNLTEPWSAINALLQGKPRRALNSLGRFVVNTTIGVGGLADHATGLGLPPTPEDFGQTLATWGVGDGGYLVLPLFGPSTVRDGVGLGVGLVADPGRLITEELINPQGFGENAAVFGARAINGRSQLIDSGVEEVLDSSADPYATARSAYRQRRAAAIADEGGGGAADADADLDAALDDLDAQSAPVTAAPEAATPPTTPPQQENEP